MIMADSIALDVTPAEAPAEAPAAMRCGMCEARFNGPATICPDCESDEIELIAEAPAEAARDCLCLECGNGFDMGPHALGEALDMARACLAAYPKTAKGKGRESAMARRARDLRDCLAGLVAALEEGAGQ